jgi:hypothetical protein
MAAVGAAAAAAAAVFAEEADTECAEGDDVAVSVN